MKDRLFVLSQYLLPHHLISRLAGCLAECRLPWVKNTFIKWFVRHFKVDMHEAQIEEPTAYEHFNAFFTRALKDGARPLDPTPAPSSIPATAPSASWAGSSRAASSRPRVTATA